MKIGFPVVVHGVHSNGHSDQPGLIATLHGQRQAANYILANVVCFPDCAEFYNQEKVKNCTSIRVYFTDIDAEIDKAARGAIYAVVA